MDLDLGLELITIALCIRRVTNEARSGGGIHHRGLETMKARDKVHSTIVLQLGHSVTGQLDVGVETNTVGPVHYHPCVMDTALSQVLGLCHTLLNTVLSRIAKFDQIPNIFGFVKSGQY